MATDNLLFNFNIDQATPIDTRLVVATITARDAIPMRVRYDGLHTYVVEGSENYQLQGGTGNDDWTQAEEATDADIKAAYERNADTNAFTDAEKVRLEAALLPGDLNVDAIHVGDYVAPLAEDFVVGPFNLDTDHIQVNDINGNSFADSVREGEKMQVALSDGTFADFTIVSLNTSFSGSTLVTFTGELPNNIQSGEAILVNQSIVKSLVNTSTIHPSVNDAGETGNDLQTTLVDGVITEIGGVPVGGSDGLEANPTLNVLAKRGANGTLIDSQIRENVINEDTTHVQIGTVEDPSQLNLKGQLFLNTGDAGNLGNVPFVPLGTAPESVYTYEVDEDTGAITHGSRTTSSLGRTTFISTQAEANAIGLSATDGQLITIEGGSYQVSVFHQLQYGPTQGQMPLGGDFLDSDVYLTGYDASGANIGTDPVFDGSQSSRYNLQINFPDNPDGSPNTSVGRYDLLANGVSVNLNAINVRIAVRQNPTDQWMIAGQTEDSSLNGHEGRIRVARDSSSEAAFGTDASPNILVGGCLGLLENVTLADGLSYVWNQEQGRFDPVTPSTRTVTALPGGSGVLTSTPSYTDNVLVQDGDFIFFQIDETSEFTIASIPAGLYRYRLVAPTVQGWINVSRPDQYNDNVIFLPGEIKSNIVDGAQTPFMVISYTNNWATVGDPAVGNVFQQNDIVSFLGTDGITDVTYWRWDFGDPSGPTDVPGVTAEWTQTTRPFAFNIEPGVDADWQNYWSRLNPYVGEQLEEVEDGLRIQQIGVDGVTREQIDLFNNPASGSSVTPTHWRLTLNEGEADTANIATLPELIASSKWGVAPTGTKPTDLTWAQLIATGDDGGTFVPADNAVAIKTAYESNGDTNAFTDADEVIVDGWGTAPTGVKPNNVSWKELTHTLVHDDVIGEISGGGELGADFMHPAVTDSLTLVVTLLNEDERDIAREQFFLPGTRAIGPTSGSFGDARIIDRVQNESSNSLLITFETGITLPASDGIDSTLTVYVVEQEFISKAEGGIYANGVITIPIAGFDSTAEALFQRVDSFGTFQSPAVLAVAIAPYDTTTHLVLDQVAYYVHYRTQSGSTAATLTTVADTATIIYTFNIN